MRPAGFELTISAGERPKAYALDRAATGTGTFVIVNVAYSVLIQNYRKIKSYV
jgi:hypothetical protein